MTKFINDEGIVEERELLVLSQHGVYIPQVFCQMVRDDLLDQGFQEHLKDIDEGPEAEWYWESWDAIVDSFRVPMVLPGEWRLWEEDGDLWAVKMED